METFLDTDLHTFSSKIRDVATSNRFIVEIVPNISIENATSTTTSDLKFFCTKATIPEVNITGPVVNFRGTKKMLSGDPKFGTLVLGFLNANNWRARNYFEDWLSSIKDYQGIKNNDIVNTAKNYKFIPYANIIVKPIDGAYSVLAHYTYYNAMPFEMSSIDLSVESSSSNQVFDVTFQYSHWFRGKNENNVDDIGKHEIVAEGSGYYGDDL